MFELMDGVLCYSRNHNTRAEAAADQVKAREEARRNISKALDGLHEVQDWLKAVNAMTIREQSTD